ncbi:hypothetical protein [Alsobacter soli]|nr:hypothetical protein [Alsobacter soli]
MQAAMQEVDACADEAALYFRSVVAEAAAALAWDGFGAICFRDVRAVALLLDFEGQDGTACLEAVVIEGLFAGASPALCAHRLLTIFRSKLAK